MMTDQIEDRINDIVKGFMKKGNAGTEKEAYDLIITTSPTMKKIVQHHELKGVKTVVEDLFDLYEVVPLNIDFDMIARKILDGKINIKMILSKIKQLHDEKGKKTKETIKKKIMSDMEKPEEKPVKTAPKPPEKQIKREGATINDEIIDEMKELVINACDKVHKFLDAENYQKFWNEVLTYVNGNGKKLINEYGGRKDYFVASLAFIAYKRVFDEDKDLKKTKDQFYTIFGFKHKNCNRSLVDIKNDGFSY